MGRAEIRAQIRPVRASMRDEASVELGGPDRAGTDGQVPPVGWQAGRLTDQPVGAGVDACDGARCSGRAWHGAAAEDPDRPRSGGHPEGLRHRDLDSNRGLAAGPGGWRFARAADRRRRQEHDRQPEAAPQPTASRFALPRLDPTAAYQRRVPRRWIHRCSPLRGWLPGYTARPRQVPPSSRPAEPTVNHARYCHVRTTPAPGFKQLRQPDELG